MNMNENKSDTANSVAGKITESTPKLKISIIFCVAIIAILAFIIGYCAHLWRTMPDPDSLPKGASYSYATSNTVAPKSVPTDPIDNPSEIIPLTEVWLEETYSPLGRHPSVDKLCADTEYLFRIELPQVYQAELENDHTSFILKISYDFQIKKGDDVKFEIRLYNRETYRLYYGSFEIEAQADLCLKHFSNEKHQSTGSFVSILDAGSCKFSFFTSALPEDGPKTTLDARFSDISVHYDISGTNSLVPRYPEYRQSITDVRVSPDVRSEKPEFTEPPSMPTPPPSFEEKQSPVMDD